MIVSWEDMRFDIPDTLINKFVEDFKGLPGSGQRGSVLRLRDAIFSILDTVAEEPNLLYEKGYATDFVRALAMKQALAKHGILYDA